MKKIFSNDKNFKVDYNALSIPEQLVIDSKIKNVFTNATVDYVYTKNRRSNNAAIKDYIKNLDKTLKYLCVDYQDRFFKNDAVKIAIWKD